MSKINELFKSTEKSDLKNVSDFITSLRIASNISEAIKGWKK